MANGVSAHPVVGTWVWMSWTDLYLSLSLSLSIMVRPSMMTSNYEPCSPAVPRSMITAMRPRPACRGEGGLQDDPGVFTESREVDIPIILLHIVSICTDPGAAMHNAPKDAR